MIRMLRLCFALFAPSAAVAAGTVDIDTSDPEDFREIPVIETVPLDLAALEAEDAARAEAPTRVAVIQPLDAALPDAGAVVVHPSGVVTSLLRVRAPNAAWMRLVFEDWTGAGNAEILVSDPSRPELPPRPLEGAPGPDGTVWTPIFFTNEVTIEYRCTGGASARISQVACGYRGFNAERTRGDMSERGGPLACQTDFSCVGALDLVDERAMATWIVCSGAECTQCSGTLVNRDWCVWWDGEWICGTDNPLMFLTAASCGATSQNLHTTVLVFEFHTPSCGAPPPDFGSLPQTRAETILVSNSQTDIALLGVASERFADWVVFSLNQITTDYWFATSCVFSSPGFMLHHPAASHLRFATLEKCGPFDNEPLRTAEGSCAANNGYELRFIHDGRPQSGSHGAPIFRASDNRIVSVLSCISTPPNCDLVRQAGGARIDLTEPQLRPYLDPVRPMHVNPAHSGYERGTAAEPLRSLARAAFAVSASDILVTPGSSQSGRAYLGRPCVVRLAGSGQSAVFGQ